MTRTAEIPDAVMCRHCRKDFRAITVQHLRKDHDYRGDHPVRDYKRRFRLRYVRCADSRRRQSERMDDFWEKRGQHWTRKRLIAEIRRMHRAGECLRFTVVHPRMRWPANRFFGSWRAAVEAAGINYDQLLLVRRWSPEEIVAAIRKLADGGVPLNRKHIERHHPALAAAARTTFPTSWGKALRAAGFDPTAHRKPKGPWDKAKALRWVLDRCEQRQSLMARDVPAKLKSFVWQTLKIGWADFVESAGIPYPGIRKRQNFWTKEKVLEEIRRWQAEGHAMHYRGVRRGYEALLQQARKYFKSWDAARAAAGV